MKGIVEIPLPVYAISRPAAADRCTDTGAESFLAGPENRLVEAAIAAMLIGPASRHNPLVLYGPSGSGKSHLARGVAAQWRLQRGHSRVIVTTAVHFVAELAEAVQSQGIDDLRDRHRSADLLVLEGVDQLARHSEAQDELSRTIDALLLSDGRVLVTAMDHPTRTEGLTEALQSRLVSGLTVPLALPGPEVRRELLRRMAAAGQIELDDAAARVLAEGVAGTIPDCRESLVQLEKASRPHGNRIDADEARRYLARCNRPSPPGLREIATATARGFSLTLSDLRSASRRRTVVTARGVAMYLARQLTDQSLGQIGQYFGGRDHSTVMHGCRKTEDLVQTDPTVRLVVGQLQRKWQAVGT